MKQAPSPSPVYDFESLRASYGKGIEATMRACKIGGAQYQKYRDEGMSREVAERMALKLGFHPYEVWPHMVDDDVAASTRTCAARGCEETFQLSLHGGPNRLYCSKRCKNRESRRRNYARNPEPTRERHRRYLAETAEYQRKARRRRYQQNAEEEKAKRRERYRRNAEVEKVKERQRKAAKRGAGRLIRVLELEQIPNVDRHLATEVA